MMAPIVAIFVWGGVCSALCQSRHRWVRGLGGVLGFVGALVCFNAMLHII